MKFFSNWTIAFFWMELYLSYPLSFRWVIVIWFFLGGGGVFFHPTSWWWAKSWSGADLLHFVRNECPKLRFRHLVGHLGNLLDLLHSVPTFFFTHKSGSEEKDGVKPWYFSKPKTNIKANIPQIPAVVFLGTQHFCFFQFDFESERRFIIFFTSNLQPFSYES